MSHQARLVGAWKLVEFEFRKTDGTVVHPFGEKARGCIIYTDRGEYSAQLMRRGRPHLAAGDQLKGTPAEVAANFEGCISYFGRYEVEESEGVIVHHVEASLFPNMEGTRQRRFFELKGDELVLRTPPTRLRGEKAVGVLVWRRLI